MQRTPGAVRVAVLCFLATMFYQSVSPQSVACENLVPVAKETAIAMNPVPHAKAHEQLTMTEQRIGGKLFHVGKLAVNAPKDQVWNILTDYESAPAHFSYLKKCSRLTPEGTIKMIQFTAKTGVGPLTVDYVLAIKETPATGTIEWQRHSGAFKENEGYWRLESVEDGRKTLITYAKHVDAGFPFPSGMVNKAVRESMPVIFKDLNASVQRVSAKSATNRTTCTASF